VKKSRLREMGNGVEADRIRAGYQAEMQTGVRWPFLEAMGGRGHFRTRWSGFKKGEG